MLTKVIKITKLSFVFLGVILLLSGTTALAQPTAPPSQSQLTLSAIPSAAAVTINLCARPGTVTMPDGNEIDIWGYVRAIGIGGEAISCDSTTPDISNLPGQLPGPVLRVNEGDVVTIHLYNQLPVPTSVVFPGQIGLTAAGDSPGTLTAEADACAGSCTGSGDWGEAIYTFTAGAPGTYLYESGTTEQPQVSMGLYGALVVDPATSGQAYTEEATAYDEEAILVLSEIDPELNADVFANPTSYTYDLLEYHPTYWLINGRAYGGPMGTNTNPDVLDPDAPLTSQPYSSAISMGLATEQTLLVRYLNAGGIHHTMSLLGLYQRIIAKDADELIGGQAYDAVAETIPSGQTTDAIIGIGEAGEYGLFNRQLHITNGGPGADHFFPGGGMMTFISATGEVPPPIAALDFNDFTIESYGVTQDVACPGDAVTVEDAGATLHIVGNCWKKIELPAPYDVIHTVGASTVLEFDFESSAAGEIHGIGFDSNDVINDPVQVFQLYGNGVQDEWGIQERVLNPYGGGLKHYKIRVGQHYTGLMTHLVFANDQDAGPLSESYFSNIQIYDEPPPLLNINGTGYLVEPYGTGQEGNPTAAIAIEDNGDTLHMIGNGWKKVVIPSYNIVGGTVLEFNFESGVQGDIHGIGFDTDETISNPIQVFQVYGTQDATPWGIDYRDYAGETPKSYSITVSDDYTGSMDYVTFTNDTDPPGGSPIAESIFSNITISEP